MGIPEQYQFTVAEIGRAVPPPYSRFIAQKVILSMGIDLFIPPESFWSTEKHSFDIISDMIEKLWIPPEMCKMLTEGKTIANG